MVVVILVDDRRCSADSVNAKLASHADGHLALV